MRLPIRLVVPCSGLTGYGQIALGLLKYLPQSPRLATEWAALYNETQPSFPDKYRSLIGATTSVRHLGLVLGIPERVKQAGTTRTILYTMYEADDIPDQWKRSLRHAAEVWVPSEHSRQVFGKYHPRVKVVHIGYDESTYKTRRGPRKKFWADMGLPLLQSGCVVGTAGVMSNRKGVDILVAAFQRSLPHKDAFLVIKSRDSKVPPIRDERIFWIESDWPPETMAKFYRALDVYAAPSRGEGLLLGPLEAVACGTPALTTRYSGPVEYIDDHNILGIDVAQQDPVRGMKTEKANWARPSASHLTSLLSQCYNNPWRARPKLSHWTWKAMAHRFENELLAAARRIR